MAKKLLIAFFLITFGMALKTGCSAAAPADSKTSPEKLLATNLGVTIEEASAMVKSNELIQLNAKPETIKNGAFFLKIRKNGVALTAIAEKYPANSEIIEFCQAQLKTLQSIDNRTLE